MAETLTPSAQKCTTLAQTTTHSQQPSIHHTSCGQDLNLSEESWEEHTQAQRRYGLYYPSPQYERRYNPVIINGYLIYTDFPSSSTNPTSIVGVDLYTGQVIWTDSTANNCGSDAAHSALSAGRVTQVSFGQVLNFVAPNQYGGIAYFWTTGTPDWITAHAQLTPQLLGFTSAEQHTTSLTQKQAHTSLALSTALT